MDNRKIILGSYLGAGIIAWFLTRASFAYLYLQFYQVRRWPGIMLLREAIPVLVGAIVFTILFKHPHVNVVMDEVVSELKKVTWPSRDDVVKSTTVVLICIAIASCILAGFDLMWGKVITLLLKG